MNASGLSTPFAPLLVGLVAAASGLACCSPRPPDDAAHARRPPPSVATPATAATSDPRIDGQAPALDAVARPGTDRAAPDARPFAAVVDQLCPPLVEARCRTRARCACAPPSDTSCAAQERARCEGWVSAVYTIVGPAGPHPIVARAMADCLRTTLGALSEAESCYAATPAEACMQLLSDDYAPRPEGSARVDRRNALAPGAACRQAAQCAPADRCARDQDCGSLMQCRAQPGGAGVCEPLACNPWRFWSPDMADNG
jgi:hypothetical protein